MASRRGNGEASAYVRQLPEQIERRLLRRAGRAAAEVIADEARLRTRSGEVREGIDFTVRKRGDSVVARVFVTGQWANAVGIWEEYGTSPHFISVSWDESNGRFAKHDKALLIGGQFAGTGVFHPGARPEPFMRPALDNKRADALTAAQNAISSGIRGGRIVAPEEGDE